MNDKYSSFSYLRVGVPEGVILSPLLFSILINSITNFITLTFYLYAHDLQIYTTTSIYEIHSELRSTLMFNLSARGADFDYR